jgi:hypothetical protein
MKIFALLILISFSLFAQDEESEALRTMRISCEKQKIGLACFNYANMLIRAKKDDSVDTYFEMGCKLDHSPSCKKEKWVIPDVIITRTPKKESDNSSSTPEVFSAFDLKSPAGSPVSVSPAQQDSNNSPPSFQSSSNSQRYPNPPNNNSPSFSPPPDNNFPDNNAAPVEYSDSAPTQPNDGMYQPAPTQAPDPSMMMGQ